MKILHIINGLNGIGGAEKSLSNLVNSGNHDFLILTLLGHKPEVINNLFCDKNLRVIHFNVFSIKSILGCVRVVRNYNPDIIQSWMYISNIFALLIKCILLKKTKIIWTIHHALDDYKSEKRTTQISVFLSKLLSSSPNKIIYCTPQIRRQHESYGFSIRVGEVIPNGIVVPSISQSENQYTDDNSEYIVGMAGRFHENKDWGTAFTTMATLARNNKNRKFRFIAVGSGIDFSNQSLKQHIESLKDIPNLQLDLRGLCHNMGDFYRELDLFILTSTTEAFGIVLAEAMSYGVPCVATKVGGVPYVLDENFSMCPPRNYQCLALSIENILNLEQKELYQLKNLARISVIERFDQNKINKKFYDLWIDLCCI